MKFPGIALAVLAVTIGAPVRSNAQATPAGLPTTYPAAFSEQGNRPDDVCGVNTLHGSYVFAASGFNIVGGVAQPKAIVEVLDFNGDGTLSVPAATLSVNGFIVRPMPGTGTYAVADDCSGSILLDGPVFDIFVSPDADVIWMIQTNPSSVFQGTATRTSRGRGRR